MTVMLVASLLGILYLLKARATVNDSSEMVGVGVAIVLLVALLIFFSLTVEVRSKQLRVSFGLGWPRWIFTLGDVRSVRVVKIPWYAGWGLRRLLKGDWLFRVSGRMAVELRMRDGKHYLIGTDQPEVLEQVIRQQLGASYD
jgi:hypothetical protein